MLVLARSGSLVQSVLCEEMSTGYSLLGWGVVCASPTLCLQTVCLHVYEGYDGAEG